MGASQIDVWNTVWLSAAADASDDSANRGDWPRDRQIVASSNRAPSISPEDAALLARLRAGEESALSELMQRYSVAVARVAYHYLRSEDLAYDVVQDVFVAVWARRAVLDDRKEFIHYLRRAARNRALDLLKHASAQTQAATRAANDTSETLPYAQNLGPVAVRAAEVNAAVRRIVTTLTPRVREVLLLYYERGLEPGEIASLLNIAPRTVYGQLRTALRVLATALVDQEDR
jgi:RNA polymerase sigma-70 factor (ECF subfamily)